MIDCDVIIINEWSLLRFEVVGIEVPTHTSGEQKSQWKYSWPSALYSIIPNHEMFPPKKIPQKFLGHESSKFLVIKSCFVWSHKDLNWKDFSNSKPCIGKGISRRVSKKEILRKSIHIWSIESRKVLSIPNSEKSSTPKLLSIQCGNQALLISDKLSMIFNKVRRFV